MKIGLIKLGCAVLILALVFSLQGGIFQPESVQALAGTIIVNSTADTAVTNGLCTLREALLNAANDNQSGSYDCPAGSGDDTITFSVSGTILLNSTLPQINTNITISGAGQAVTISGNDDLVVFSVVSGGSLTLDTLSVQHGYAASGGGVSVVDGRLSVNNSSFVGNTATESGGAIYNQAGTVTITKSTFTNNSGKYGGAINTGWQPSKLSVSDSTFTGNNVSWQGGAIFARASDVSITGSTFSSNTAMQGGAIYHSYGTFSVSNSTIMKNMATSTGGQGGEGAGIYSNDNTTTLTNVVITQNTALFWGGGIESNYSTITISGSVISDNSAGARGGGIYHGPQGRALTVMGSAISNNHSDFGGGLYIQEAATLVNSTLNGNSARQGGGAANISTLALLNTTLSANTASADGGGIYNTGTVTLLQDTLAGNQAPNGGGIYRGSGMVYLAATILAKGSNGTNCYNGGGPQTDNGYNVSDDGSCHFAGMGSQNSAALNLGALAKNGGQTFTHLPEAGSSAIDRVPWGAKLATNGFTYTCDQTGEGQDSDQRGQPRPATTHGRCDAGAVEAADLNGLMIDDAGVVEDDASTVYAVFLVSLSLPSDQGVTVQYATADGSATAGADYQATSGTLTFNSGDPLTKTMMVPVLGDTQDENDTENFYVNLTNASGALIVDSSAVGSIYDNELIVNRLDVSDDGACDPLAAGDCTLREAIVAADDFAGGGVITFNTSGTITLTSALPDIYNAVTINGMGQAITIDGNQAARAFWVTPTGILTLNNLTIRNGKADFGGAVYNNGKLTLTGSTFSENVSTDSGGAVYNSTGRVTTTDSTFTANAAGNSGGGIYAENGRVTVALSRFSQNTAGAGGGLYGSSGATLAVTDSTFTGNISNGGGGGIYSGGTLTVTGSTFSANSAVTMYGGGIAAMGTSTITNSTFSANAAQEGGGIANGYTLTVTNGTFTGNSAITGAAISNRSAWNVLSLRNSILANSSQGTDCYSPVALAENTNNLIQTNTGCGTPLLTGDPMLGPLADNGGPTWTHALLQDSPAINKGDTAVCPTTDQRGVKRPQAGLCDMGAYEAEPPTFRFDSAAYQAAEGAGPATITVLLGAVLPETATVHYTVTGGSAAAGSDFTAAEGTLTFAPGQVKHTFTVDILNDNTIEPDETIQLTLSSPTGAALGDPNTTVLTVHDEDQLPYLCASLSALGYTVAEGGNAAVITVNYGPATAQTVTVNYSVSGNTATEGSDFTAVSGALIFNPGETQKTFSVPVLQDTLDEPDESVMLSVSANVSNPCDAPPALLTIQDDDPAPAVAFSQSGYTVDEAAGTATVTVSLNAASGKTVTVSYATENGSATAGSDYESASGTLTFAPGQTSQTITVHIVKDNQAEGEENFHLVLSNPGEAVLGEVATANVVIQDSVANYPVLLPLVLR